MTVQTVLNCGRSVRVTTHALPVTVNQMELKNIIGLVDSLIADRIPVEGAEISEFTANLMSAYTHLVRASKELAKEPMAVGI